MNPNILVSISNLSKTFSIPKVKRHTVKDHLFNFYRPNPKTKLQVLSNINFEVKKGEFISIIGSNGSGKSTLLKILAKIYQPDPGSKIQINASISPFLELGVGFNPELTARENIYLNATILGLSKKKIDEVFDQIIDFAELSGFVDQHIKYFSSGMQVRLAFSVAIQAKADILILDEVLAVGDAHFQQKCYTVFEEFKKQGKTIIYVSHDLGTVQTFSDRVIYLKDSRIEQIGSPKTVIEQYLANENN